MAQKTDFTAQDWQVIVSSPMIVAAAVVAAEPSGLFGLLKESMASAKALVSAKTDPNADALVKAVADDIGSSEGRTAAQAGVKAALGTVSSAAEVKERALAGLKAVVAILDAKAPADASAFKAWLAGVAKATAEAASEGGFLGFGGVKVSDAEKATLGEIAAALGTAPPSV